MAAVSFEIVLNAHDGSLFERLDHMVVNFRRALYFGYFVFIIIHTLVKIAKCWSLVLSYVFVAEEHHCILSILTRSINIAALFV